MTDDERHEEELRQFNLTKKAYKMINGDRVTVPKILIKSEELKISNTVNVSMEINYIDIPFNPTLAEQKIILETLRKIFETRYKNAESKISNWYKSKEE